MPKFSALESFLLSAGLLLLVTPAPSHAQDRKNSHTTEQATTENGLVKAFSPAPAVLRRTDGHTVNVTMDPGPNAIPRSPKMGSEGYEHSAAKIGAGGHRAGYLGSEGYEHSAASPSGLPPAVDAGSFQARPAATAAPSQRGTRLSQQR